MLRLNSALDVFFFLQNLDFSAIVLKCLKKHGGLLLAFIRPSGFCCCCITQELFVCLFVPFLPYRLWTFLYSVPTKLLVVSVCAWNLAVVKVVV